jgi:hypothetical protein
MANSNYTPKELKSLQDWVRNIEEATELRQMFPPQIIVHKTDWVGTGYVAKCLACGSRINVDFGDFSKPLDEKFVPCIIDDKGHGHWGSAINICLN